MSTQIQISISSFAYRLRELSNEYPCEGCGMDNRPTIGLSTLSTYRGCVYHLQMLKFGEIFESSFLYCVQPIPVQITAQSIHTSISTLLSHSDLKYLQ